MKMEHLARSVLLLVLSLSFGVCAARADPHPAGFRNHRFNGANPVTEGGVTTFRIHDEECSKVKYGDGRGESDCYNGNVRSTLGRSQQERLGETVEYSFELWVDPSISYTGFSNSHAAGYIGNLRDSRLRIASWEGPLLHNFLYMLKLDQIHGVRFLSKTCFDPETFGKWNRFSMKVRWASNKRGWIKVTCNDRIVWLDEAVATNQAPQCYITNQCEPGVTKNPGKFLFIVGPVMAGFGHEWKKWGRPGPFTKIQPEGIEIKVRNLAVTKGARLYDDADTERVKELQSHLEALGCDPGPVDGVVGQKTRDAAVTCRDFAEGVLPDRLDVSTLPAILSAYREHFPLEAKADQ